jgi:hypothetical protein
MKSKRWRRWLRLAGRAVLWVTVPWGGVHFCLPPASVIERWPADAGMWTPEGQLSRPDRRAWSQIEAGLREDGAFEVPADGSPRAPRVSD